MSSNDWEPVQRVRTHELVMAQIEALLREGKLRPGDQLPSERDLSSLLGISRSSLRESLRVLEALGVIEVRLGGGGTILRSVPGEGFVLLLQLELSMGHFADADVIGTRMALEAWCCGTAALSATDEDLKELTEILDQMDDPTISAAQFNELDTAFHLRIAKSAGNALTTHLMRSLGVTIRRQITEAYIQLTDWRATAVDVRAEHRGILTAIINKDENSARTLVQEHIASFFLTRHGGVSAT